MISPEILKKHNLKAVPFSCIGEGETFHFGMVEKVLTKLYERRLERRRVDFSDGKMSAFLASDLLNKTVYVPVDRPTIKGEVL